jgi:hypothetical protein
MIGKDGENNLAKVNSKRIISSFRSQNRFQTAMMILKEKLRI